jgi:hypothetical protein
MKQKTESRPIVRTQLVDLAELRRYLLKLAGLLAYAAASRDPAELWATRRLLVMDVPRFLRGVEVNR